MTKSVIGDPAVSLGSIAFSVYVSMKSVWLNTNCNPLICQGDHRFVLGGVRPLPYPFKDLEHGSKVKIGWIRRC